MESTCKNFGSGGIFFSSWNKQCDDQKKCWNGKKLTKFWSRDQKVIILTVKFCFRKNTKIAEKRATKTYKKWKKAAKKPKTSTTEKRKKNVSALPLIRPLLLFSKKQRTDSKTAQQKQKNRWFVCILPLFALKNFVKCHFETISAQMQKKKLGPFLTLPEENSFGRKKSQKKEAWNYE